MEVEGVSYDSDPNSQASFKEWHLPMFTCSDSCLETSPSCNGILPGTSQCNEPEYNNGQFDPHNPSGCETINARGHTASKIASANGGNVGDFAAYCSQGTDCTNCGVYIRPFRYTLAAYPGTVYDAGGYNSRGAGPSNFVCCDNSPWIRDGVDPTGHCRLDQPPRTPPPPAHPPPSPPPADSSLVDRSCAPHRFRCFDDASKGWDDNSNSPVDNAVGTAFECDITAEPSGAGYCNDGSDSNNYHNCQKGCAARAPAARAPAALAPEPAHPLTTHRAPLQLRLQVLRRLLGLELGRVAEGARDAVQRRRLRLHVETDRLSWRTRRVCV